MSNSLEENDRYRVECGVAVRGKIVEHFVIGHADTEEAANALARGDSISRAPNKAPGVRHAYLIFDTEEEEADGEKECGE